MTGWVALGVLSVGAFVALGLVGYPRGRRWLVIATLALGGAGYAVQQRADLPGHPVSSQPERVEFDPDLAALRSAMMPGNGDADALLRTADTQLAGGDTRGAVETLLGAVRARPEDATVWTGLGGAIATHDEGRLSPAAQFAFQRAWRLAPLQPGPPFFLGQAFAQSGDLQGAKTAWLRALALAPREAPYRVAIAERLAILDSVAGAMPAGR